MKFAVASCLTCPFYRRTLIAALAGGDGDCGHDNAHVPPKTLPIAKGLAATVPTWCPLRIEPATIILEGN
jgi:hypothetical protein